MSIEKRLQEASRTWGVGRGAKLRGTEEVWYGVLLEEHTGEGKTLSLQNCKRFTTQKCQVLRKANARIETEKWEIN